MANESFERAYRDALDVLYRRGKKIGKPHYRQDGLRYCLIDQIPLGDRDVLKEAWGEKLAAEIFLERNDSPESGCSECDRLWETYADLMNRYLVIVRREQNPENRQISGANGGFSPLYERAIDSRVIARKAVLNHIATHEKDRDRVGPTSWPA
jgi:hypothetical protein